MGFSIENAGTFLTPYLTQDRKIAFLSELKDFPNVKPLYANIADPEPLQGDCWSGVTVLRFETGEKKAIKAILLSNSCDVSASNQRAMPVRLNFAPIISWDRYATVLKEQVSDSAKVANHLEDVRNQRVSSLFFLPAGALLVSDSIAVLDDVHSIPLNRFSQDDGVKRLASLSDLGFWLFLFKLSFHFCRIHEHVDRTPA